MRDELEIFNQPLAALMEQAGFPYTEAERHLLTRNYKLERSPCATERLISVTSDLMRHMAPQCLSHIKRKNRGNNFETPDVHGEYFLRQIPICRFTFADTAFRNRPNEIAILEGLSDAQSILYWLKDNTSHMPIVINADELALYNPWRTPKYHAMSPKFRALHRERLTRILNTLPRHTVFGEAWKNSYGLNGPTLIDSIVEEELQQKAHVWNLQGRIVESSALLDMPGKIDERHLLAACWRFVQLKWLQESWHQEWESRNKSRFSVAAV